MHDLQMIITELYDSILELDDTAFVANAQAKLDGYTRAAVLIAIFRTFENSLSRSMLIHLGFWFEEVIYQDIVTAMLDLGPSNLPAYHFGQYVPEVLGVDIIQVAQMIQQHSPEYAQRVGHFAMYKQLIGPSIHARQCLRECGADVEKIYARLRTSGAPLLPEPVPIQGST